MLRVGVFGGGVVGGGVCELLQRHASRLTSLGLTIQVAKICIRDPSKPRDFPLDPSTQVVTNFDDILEDPAIGCVVEVIGGVTAARDIVLRALKAGKHVVTANKAHTLTIIRACLSWSFVILGSDRHSPGGAHRYLESCARSHSQL